MATEQRYIRRLGGVVAADPVFEGDRPSFDVLKRATQVSGATLARMVASADPHLAVSGVTDEGVAFETEAAVFLVQTVNHSTGHRAQVIGMLTMFGAAPANLDEQIDAWSWGEATGALRSRPA